MAGNSYLWNLSNVFLTKTKFGLNIYPPSTKFVQCQTVARSVLKSSPNKDIQTLRRSASISTCLQYDTNKDTKQVLKAFHSDQEDRMKSHLVSQGSFSSSVTSYSLPKFNSIWSSAQSICQKIYSISLSDTSIMHFILGKSLKMGPFVFP